MVAMATLAVHSGVMSPHCAESSRSKIVENLQDVTEALKQVCENPETFDLRIANAQTGTNVAQNIPEVMVFIDFVQIDEKFCVLVTLMLV